jgi:hypothetical protein
LLVAICLTAVVLALVAEVPSRIELAAAVALLVTTAGFRLETRTLGGVDLDIGYGALVGFVAAAVLVGVALAGSRRTDVAWNGGWTEALGAALGAAYVAAVALPWWGISSLESWSTLSNGLARLSWLTVAAALVAVRLTGRWIVRIAGRPADADELVVLPLVLGALVALDVFRYGFDDMTWNTALLGGLALASIALGLVERAGGFARVQIPESLRVDRI